MTGTSRFRGTAVTSKEEAEPVRFYSMNVVDLATRRCATQPLFSRSGNAVYAAFWAIWQRLGMPRHLQVDNEMAFYGSPTIPGAWGRSSACACIMASPSGSSRPPNPGAMAWSKVQLPLPTLGLAGRTEHLLDPGAIPVRKVDRGGQYEYVVTYHGPGQLVVYLLIDLKRLRERVIHTSVHYG